MECDTVSRDIWLWAIARQNWLSAAYTPGKDNVADALSREFNTALEWTVKSSIFDKIVIHFGAPDVDLFASRINNQIDAYVSWKPDPHALYIDAFTVHWASFTNSYAFPPFCLICRCLQKVVQDKNTMIILVPVWPTQAWFTRLLSLLIECPRFFCVTANVLSNPLHGEVHPLSPKLMPMACKISGETSLTAAFLHQLPLLSCVHRDQVRKNNTMVPVLYSKKS